MAGAAGVAGAVFRDTDLGTKGSKWLDHLLIDHQIATPVILISLFTSILNRHGLCNRAPIDRLISQESSKKSWSRRWSSSASSVWSLTLIVVPRNCSLDSIRLKVKGLDFYRPPLTGKPRPAAVYNWSGILTGNDTTGAGLVLLSVRAILTNGSFLSYCQYGSSQVRPPPQIEPRRRLCIH